MSATIIQFPPRPFRDTHDWLMRATHVWWSERTPEAESEMHRARQAFIEESRKQFYPAP